MSRPKDNLFAPTNDRISDFIYDLRERHGTQMLTITAGSGEEMKLSDTSLLQLVMADTEKSMRIAAFVNALKDLQGLR